MRALSRNAARADIGQPAPFARGLLKVADREIRRLRDDQRTLEEALDDMYAALGDVRRELAEERWSSLERMASGWIGGSACEEDRRGGWAQ